MIRISCQNPKFIVNRKIFRLPPVTYVSLQGVVRPLNALDYMSLSQCVSPFDIFKISRPKSFSYEFCEQFYFVLSDGEIVDMFMAVPCRCCSACRCSLVSIVRQKLLCALQEFRVPPLFVTLTYNERSLPSGHDVCRRDVQLFLKRLRIYLKRHFNAVLKYYYVSEYTPVTKRPHYHLVLFGVPFLSNNPVQNQYMRFHLMQYCWRKPLKGYTFEQYRKDFPVIFKRKDYYDPYSYGYIDVSEMRDLKCVNYLMKYMHKNIDDVLITDAYDPLTISSCIDPKDAKSYKRKSRYFRTDFHKRNFRGSSVNLGVDFVSKHITPNDFKVVFTDWLSRRVQEFRLCGYYLNKLFPSFSSLIPTDVRRSYFNALYEINHLLLCCNVPKNIISSCIHTKTYLKNNLGTLFPCYIPQNDFDEKTIVSEDFLSHSLELIAQSTTVCYRFIMSADFDSILKKVALRDLVISKYPLREYADYKIFDIKMNECINNQKML